MTGKVILVGAGPGDPGLLTLKGKEALSKAQVVVYDRLVSPAILAMMPEKAEKINVGKESAHHLVPQEGINQILLQKALEGKRVVRLKGGDPFLFGRGGEELELLKAHQVPFEEVPGITSAIAVPAYGGIPVTHRDFTSSLHIITGHQRAGKPLTIPFEALVNTKGTLVFLMGVSALPEICKGLLSAGMDPHMPAATIERGTRADQRVTLSTVEKLPADAKEKQVKSPAIIIVGKVCTLSEQFNWFQSLPLTGKHILVTRPKDRAGTLTGRLRELGALVTEFPCIQTIPYTPCPQMEQEIARISQYAWLAFTSAAGVQALFAMLEEKNLDVRALGNISIAAIGPGTDRELKKHGLRADLIPEIYDGEHLGQELGKIAQGKVLILRAQWGTSALTDALSAAQVPFEDVKVYETRYTCPDSCNPQDILEEKPLITFTSASTVRGFAAAMGNPDLSGLTGVCIGKQTEAEARKHGMKTITAKQATIDSLIDRMIEGE